MQNIVTVHLGFIHDRGYIADPYLPARERLINLQKVSGMNRVKSEEKRQQTLKDYLQRQGMTLDDYAALEVEANAAWYRASDQEIIIPSHQLYGCLIESCHQASSALRPCDPDNLRHVLMVSDFRTGKGEQDGVFERLVMPKSGTGQPLSNQRALRSNPYIAQFHATGTFKFFPDDLRGEGETLFDFVCWAGQRIGVGASRKMGYGRFVVSKWDSHEEDTARQYAMATSK